VSAIGQWGRILGRAASRWYDDDAPQLGAGLAYYSLFSVAPLLVIAAAIAGVAFGEDSVRRELETQLAQQLGTEPAKTLLGLVEAAAKPRQGFWAALVGGGAMVIGAVSFFVSLRAVFARIWKSEAKPAPSGLVRIVGTYTVATAMVVGGGLLLMAALAISAALAGLQGLGGELPGTALLWRAVELAVSLAVTMLVFALVFRLTSQFGWRHVWFGAVVTAILYAIGKAVFGLYVEWSGVKSGYGAAGALVVFLVWVYYTAQIILFGAEAVAASAALRADSRAEAGAAQLTGRLRGV
jgi:membrane protein